MKHKLEINHKHVSGESSISLQELFIKTIKLVSIVGLTISVPLVFGYSIYNHDFKPIDIPEPVNVSINEQVDNMYGYGGNDLNYVSKGDARKIEKLKLDLTEENIDLSFLESFESLRRLELTVNHESWEFINSIPELSKLKSLKLFNSTVVTPTVLSTEDLHFLKNLPNLKELELNVCSTIIPAGIIEEFCPDLEKISINNWRNDNILTDFNNLYNLKELQIHNSTAQSVAPSFSRNDYKVLIDKGVSVSINTKTPIENYWERYEKYYTDLNLSNCETPKETIDTILIGMNTGIVPYSEQADAARTLRALTHMAGIDGKYIQGNVDCEEKDCCLIDLYNTSSYFEFNPHLILSDKNSLVAIANGQTDSIPGYMQEIDIDSFNIRTTENNKGLRR